MKMGKKSITKDILNTIEVFGDAMHYLSNCGLFDESKFKKLDRILVKADAAFGPVKRAEMIAIAKQVLPIKVGDGLRDGRGSLRLELFNRMNKGFDTSNKFLMETSPDQSTVKKVLKIINKIKKKKIKKKKFIIYYNNKKNNKKKKKFYIKKEY